MRTRQTGRTVCYTLALALALFTTGVCRADTDLGYLDNYDARRSFENGLGELYEQGTLVELDEIEKQLAEERTLIFKPAVASDETLTPEALYERCRAGVVKVGKIYKCDNCERWHSKIATGFIIGSSGIVVTAYHVVDKDNRGEAFGVQTYDGKMLPVERVLAADKLNDFAVLKVDGVDLPALPVAESVARGAPVVVISHPVGKFYVLTEGIVSGKMVQHYHGKLRRALAITADYAKGSSGGPVFDMHGAVVGMVRTTVPVYYHKKHGIDTALQMVWKYCAPTVALRELLSGQRPGPAGDAHEHAPPPEDHEYDEDPHPETDPEPDSDPEPDAEPELGHPE